MEKVAKSSGSTSRREPMRMPEEVAAMKRLHELGWGKKRIARELGCSVNTVRRYLRQGGWAPYKRPERKRALDEYGAWLEERLLRHRGNAAVVHQELARQHELGVSLRTVERAVAPCRQRLRAEAKATIRFETRPGRQLQADFGQCLVTIAGERVRVHVCVLTLGFSRRSFVRPWPCERQAQWLETFESAFAHFGGVPEELLIDNARALVIHHDPRTREVVFHPTFVEFCRHWGTTPRACAPYRARTKGKDERSVGYVKRNAIAGHEFEAWSAFEAHLAWWAASVADVRVHGTVGERPIDRFEREEAQALAPLDGRPPFAMRRTLSRRVHSDLCVEVDTNQYSVPLDYIGHEVTVEVVGAELSVYFGSQRIAHHGVVAGKHQRVVDPQHLAGVVKLLPSRSTEQRNEADLLRPLAEYEAVAQAGAR